MPELPDVEIFKYVAKNATGQTIEEVDIKDKHFVNANDHNMKKYVEGNELKRVLRRGKYLFLNTKNNKGIVMHFGMTGSLEYQESEEEDPKYVKCKIRLGNDHFLFYTSKRKLGSVEFTHSIDGYISDNEIGIDALEIEEDEFSDKVRESHSMIKSFLMDQSEMSGIGNVYSDEILFQSGIHPEIKSNKLDDEKVAELYKNMKKVLQKAIEEDAKTHDLPGSYLLPNREAGEECPRCQGKIEKIKVSGRTGYYCPKCQKK